MDPCRGCVSADSRERGHVQGYLAHETTFNPLGTSHCRVLGGFRFRVSEVPLYAQSSWVSSLNHGAVLWINLVFFGPTTFRLGSERTLMVLHCVRTSWMAGDRPVSGQTHLISHEQFLKSFCRSQLTQKNVNLSSTATHINGFWWELRGTMPRGLWWS